ncbi:hypothetical protein [Streptomyces sp. NPDC096193]|uniref:hypothetical protein n=1 Tax=Streptomyces sp. NPDC096193 TaxID=3155821 RepID=UPI00332F8A8B
MTDTTTTRTATEGTWALPLAVLAPLALVRLLTEPTTPWLVLSWILWSVSALLIAAGWTTVLRKGTRGNAAWGMCAVVHAVLAWQLISLVGE